MVNFKSKISECNICKTEYSSFHYEAIPGHKVYVCQKCLKSAKDNFIWICINCGRSYIRPKNLVINRCNGYEVKDALILNEIKLIQGIHMCIGCNPKGILDCVKGNQNKKECSV